MKDFSGFIVLRSDSVFTDRMTAYVMTQVGMIDKFLESGKTGEVFLLEDCLGFELQYSVYEGEGVFRNVYIWSDKTVASRWWVLDIFRNYKADLVGALNAGEGLVSAWFDLKNSQPGESWWNSVVDVEGMQRMLDGLHDDDKAFLALNGTMFGLLSKNDWLV